VPATNTDNNRRIPSTARRVVLGTLGQTKRSRYIRPLGLLLGAFPAGIIHLRAGPPKGTTTGAMIGLAKARMRRVHAILAGRG